MDVSIESKLRSLEKLPPNWDSYGALPINRVILQAATTFARLVAERIEFLPHVTPTSNGGLQFEWHRGRKTLEMEFENEIEVHYLQWNPDAAIKEEGVFSSHNIGFAVDLIRWHQQMLTAKEAANGKQTE